MWHQDLFHVTAVTASVTEVVKKLYNSMKTLQIGSFSYDVM